ncbi:MAG: hypothetical protein ACO2PM_25120 [Pyrobaculum sp.]|jgi:hypothetical protein
MFDFINEWGEKLFRFSVLSALMYTLVTVGVANAGLITLNDLPPLASWVNWFVENNVSGYAVSNDIFSNLSAINALMTIFVFLYNLMTWLVQLAQFASGVLSQFGAAWAGWAVTAIAAFAQFVTNYYIAWRMFLFVKTVVGQVSIRV